ncbi:MAG: response regulator [Anaerolineaceae bacterium]|nr:response regulator [Anaerolineaceae bacterium]
MAEETKKILLVDDERDILEAMQATLEPLGQEILLAHDGNEAVEMALEYEPDVIVLDLMLPKRGGFLVLQKLKGSPQAKGKKPLVIMITGNEGQRHKVFAQSLGVDEYLNKPFRMDRLSELVQGFLQKS